MDLERENLLPVALEAKVAGLDDAGVHGPDGNLVDTGSIDLKKGVLSHASAIAARALVEVRMAPERLQPRMTVRMDAVGLEHFPFECLRLGKLGRERWIRAVRINVRSQKTQTAAVVVGQHGEDFCCRA